MARQDHPQSQLWEEIYTRYYRPLLRLAGSYLSRQEDAEDAVQQTFERLMCRRRTKTRCHSCKKIFGGVETS